MPPWPQFHCQAPPRGTRAARGWGSAASPGAFPPLAWHRRPPGSAAVARSAGRGRRRAARPALLAPALPLQRLGRPGGLTGNQALTEAAAGLIVPPSHKGLQGTTGEIWVQSHAANSGLTPDSSTHQKSGANQPVAGSGSARTEQPCPHPGLPNQAPVHHPLSAHLTLIPAPPSPPLPYHLGVFFFITIATILELWLDPGRVEST